jgi:hypothetical protein
MVVTTGITVSTMSAKKGKNMKKKNEHGKLQGLKIHQIKNGLVGIIDKDNKLIAQGRRFSEQSQDANHVVWSWIRKDYQ